MTLATDLYLRLSGEEALISGMPGVLEGLVGTLGTVVSDLIAESPSLANFFPIPSDIAAWDLTDGPVIASIGGYNLSMELVGLLNKPNQLEAETEDENKLFLIVDVSIVRDASDVPFVSTIGIAKVDGVWEEFIPSVEAFYTYDAITNLHAWFEDFLRVGMLEHRFSPGPFEYDEDMLLEDIGDDITVEVID
ncbi:MAG: hypothetical protein H7338_25535 [Candidatus Sericytochromatia bacterium]|nr:hypothetical protein [Candidatus Sericytochromatia bacterium]